MSRHDVIDTDTVTATPVQPAIAGPRDAREVAFVRALTASTVTPAEKLVGKLGGLFLMASAGFVVAAAIIASL
ncbi:MAG: hypothetical protein AAFR79_12625 [Pseudomonadota bacterium]